jgi:phage terminase small subunit
MASLLNIDPHGPYAAQLVKCRQQMTPQEIMFVEELCVHLDEARAAAECGLPPKQGRSFAKRHWVKEAFTLWQLERTERLEATADKTIREFAKVAYANMGDYLEPNADGDMVVKVPGRDRDRMAALQEYTVETYMEGRGDEARPVRRAKIKLADKLAGLNALARVHGIFEDKVKVSGEIEVKIKQMTRAERLQWAYNLLKPMEQFLTPAELAGEVIEHEEVEASTVDGHESNGT